MLVGENPQTSPKPFPDLSQILPNVVHTRPIQKNDFDTITEKPRAYKNAPKKAPKADKPFPKASQMPPKCWKKKIHGMNLWKKTFMHESFYNEAKMKPKKCP